jgi:hypothetical protein
MQTRRAQQLYSLAMPPIRSGALRAAFHTKELLTYLVDGSALTDEKFAAAIYESRDWSDFVLVARPQ